MGRKKAVKNNEKYRIWTEEEDNYIKENHSKVTLQKLADNLKRSRGAVSSRASKLEVTRKKVLWTTQDDEKLIDLYNLKLGISEISEVLSSSIDAVDARLRYLDIKRDRWITWSENETKFLIENYSEKGPYFCVKALGKKYSVIVSKAANLKLKVKNGYKDRLRSESLRWCGHELISKSYFSRIKRGAKDRNIKYSEDITIEYLWQLFIFQDKKCAITGIDLNFNTNLPGEKSNQNASLDRIDSSKGYEDGNVQWVDRQINLMKRDMSQEDFIELCHKIAERYPKC